MRIVSIERGRDPRHYALVAFGGAGPVHAGRLAHALDIPRVIVPRGAGVGSALGLLVAERKIDFGLTRVVRLDGTAQAAITTIFAELEQRVMAEARRMQGQGDITLHRSASMHHIGQGYEIRVELPASPMDRDDEAAMRTGFYDRYEQEYGYVDPDSAIEVTDWHLIAVIVGSRAGSTLRLDNAVRGGAAVIGRRPAWFPETGGMTECPIIDRYAMPPGEVFAGPALVEERESTTVVLPGDTASISVHGNLIIDIGALR